MRLTSAIASVAGAGTLLAATTAVMTLSAGPAEAATLSQAWYAQAPYVMPTDNNPPNLPAVMSATGEKAFMLAFILANGSACSAAWDGTAPVSSDTAVAGVINGVRAAGGDVSVSIGGYGGTKLGQVCSNPTTTAAAYQAVINKYSLKALDFDLEEPEYENTTAISNEVGAEQILQRNNPGVYLSITVPGTTSGTGYFGQNVLNTAKSLGFTPDNYSIMPFDGGFNGAASQQSALSAFNGMLTTTFGWSAATAWAHEGVSQMNGRSDTGEIFTQADFASNLSFAKSKGLGRYTFWSVNRDRQCPGGANSTTSGTCSSAVQNDWDFTKYDVQFAGQVSTGGGGATAGANGPVRSTIAGKCLDVNAGSSANGTSVQLWDCNGTAAQSWTVYSDGTLRALGKCLDATGAGTANATKTELWDCNGGGNQVWQGYNGGYRNPVSGRCLDDPAATSSNATQLELWDCNGTNAQLWSAPGAASSGGGSTGGTSCAGLAAYGATAVYTNGMSVSYNSHKWTAKWWTQGEAPSTGGSGVWADNGAC